MPVRYHKKPIRPENRGGSKFQTTGDVFCRTRCGSPAKEDGVGGNEESDKQKITSPMHSIQDTFSKKQAALRMYLRKAARLCMILMKISRIVYFA